MFKWSASVAALSLGLAVTVSGPVAQAQEIETIVALGTGAVVLGLQRLLWHRVSAASERLFFRGTGGSG